MEYIIAVRFFQWSSVCIKVWHVSVGRQVPVKCNFAYGCYCPIQIPIPSSSYRVSILPLSYI